MKSIDQVVEELQQSAQRALAENPDKSPLEPFVSYEQAVREYYMYCDEVAGKALDDTINFRMGQHVSRMSMCAVLEATAQFPVSQEQRLAAYIRYHERNRALHLKVGKDLGYEPL